ncbi:MAG: ABC transporter substrate-binding protein [Clostridia bacterium]|nr:ABC transporter substrate-binding protein [Clostridia bacterium]
MLKRILAAFLCLACICSFSACKPEEEITETQPAEVKKYENHNEIPTDGGTLKLCLFETDTLNPLITQNAENIRTLMPLYNSLFTVNQDFSYAPDLCDSFSVYDDGINYSFELKNGITFHDGSPLTASDAAFSLSLIFEAQSPIASKLSDIASFSANGQTLFISLKRPVANLPALLDFPIISAKSAANTADAIEKKAEYLPNGTGMYKLQSYKKNKEIHLIRNDEYHQNLKSYISDILVYLVNDRSTAIKMLENLSVDLISSNVANPDEYTPKRTVSSVDYATNQFTFLAFNHDTPALKHSRTRRAISTAIDRSALVRDLPDNRVVICDIPIHPESWLYRIEREMTAFDAELAKNLLTDDGWNDSDSDGRLDRIVGEQTEVLELSILVNQENPQRVKLANQIKSYLEKAGIWVYVVQVPFAEYTQRLNDRRYDMAICEVDISDNSDLKFLLQSGYNIFNVSNELLDNLMLEADKLDDTAKIQEMYWEMCTLLQQDMPICGLYFKNASIIFDESVKGNILPTESNIFNNINEWFITEK